MIIQIDWTDPANAQRVITSIVQTLGDQVVDGFIDNSPTDYTISGTKNGQAFSEVYTEADGYVCTDITPA